MPPTGPRNQPLRPTSNIRLGTEVMENSNILPQGMSLEQENLFLKRALNQQIEENRTLVQRIRYLEAENDDLSHKLGMIGSKGVRSTNYNSVNYGDVSYCRSSVPPPTTAKFNRPRTNYNLNEEAKPLDFTGDNRSNQSSGILAELNALKR